GSVSLKDESLDLRLVVAPKDFSLMSLRSPLRVKGPFKAPHVSVEKGPIATKVGAAVLLSLLNPLAALIPFIDPGSGDSDADNCPQMLERAREAGRLQKARSG
ncbi:MAG TPA: AsmA family protein, partial [Rhizobacter sp.]|nr:AsmA family protein [Rhizobacter sp.]